MHVLVWCLISNTAFITVSQCQNKVNSIVAIQVHYIFSPLLTEKYLYVVVSLENSDYVGVTNVPISFVYGHGYSSHQCTNVTINQDRIVEYNESFDVILTENSSKLTIPYGRNYTRITIMEDSDCKLHIISMV